MDDESTNVVRATSESAESSSSSSGKILGLSSVEQDDGTHPVVNLIFGDVVDNKVLPARREKGVLTEGVEEKSTESAEAGGKEVGTTEQDNSVDSIVDGQFPLKIVQESVVLKESEKKALQGLKEKIEESINENYFFSPGNRKTGSSKSKKKDTSKKGAKRKGSKGKAEGNVDAKPEVEGGDVPSTEVAEPESPLPLSVEPSEVVVKEEIKDAAAVENETMVATSEAHNPSIDTNTGQPTTQDSLIEQDQSSSLPEQSTTQDTVIEREDSSSLQDLSLWGVPLLPSKGDERLDVVLLKFLRARMFKVNDAFSMLQKTMIWRKSFRADTLINKGIATNEFDSVAYMYGYDKQGHPVCYNHFGVFQDKELYAKTIDDEDELNRFLQWRIQLLEKGIQQLDFKPGGVNSMVQVTDLEDFPGLLKRMNVTKKFVTLLQENYPELVAKQIIINVPWYFGALYSLPAMTVRRRLKKVVLARPQKVIETLFRYISPEYIPLRYGGLSRPNDTEFEDEVPVMEVTVKPSAKQTIELPVKESGVRVTWDIAVVGWDVVYGEEFVPSGEGSYTVIIQKSKKVALSEETIRNSFKVNEPGNVVLTIDNTASKKNRLAVYRYALKEVTASAP